MNDNLDMIYGIHPVMEALRSKKRNVTQLYVSDSKAGHRAVEEIIRLAKRQNVKIDRIDNKTLDRLTRNANHQGVMAKVQPIKLMKLSTALYESDGNKKDLWLAVDEMTDPQNLGAIIRSAACLGFSTIILPQRRTVGITPAVYKVACGAIENINIVEVSNLSAALNDLKEEGFWLNIHREEGGASPKLLIHTNQLSMVSDELIERIAEKVKEFIVSNSITI